jgi:transposase
VVTKKGVEARIRGLVTGHAMLEQIAKAMLAARSALLTEFNKLHKAVLDIARRDEVFRRLMTTPSIGAIVAITYKSALDDPSRIKKSKNAGPLFGLTPKRYQSGVGEQDQGCAEAIRARDQGIPADGCPDRRGVAGCDDQ